VFCCHSCTFCFIVKFVVSLISMLSYCLAFAYCPVWLLFIFSVPCYCIVCMFYCFSPSSSYLVFVFFGLVY
jgi:hypothetical protein